jgi:hypothetical protein
MVKAIILNHFNTQKKKRETLNRKPDGKKPRSRWECNIKTDVTEIGCESEH